MTDYGGASEPEMGHVNVVSIHHFRLFNPFPVLIG